MKEKLKQELKEIFEEFKRIPFPDRSDNYELCNILFDLVELDGWVVGMKNSYLTRGTVNKERVFIDDNWNTRLRNFVPSSENESKSVEEYKKYKSYLDKMVWILKKIQK